MLQTHMLGYFTEPEVLKTHCPQMLLHRRKYVQPEGVLLGFRRQYPHLKIVQLQQRVESRVEIKTHVYSHEEKTPGRDPSAFFCSISAFLWQEFQNVFESSQLPSITVGESSWTETSKPLVVDGHFLISKSTYFSYLSPSPGRDNGTFNTWTTPLWDDSWIFTVSMVNSWMMPLTVATDGWLVWVGGCWSKVKQRSSIVLT